MAKELNQPAEGQGCNNYIKSTKEQGYLGRMPRLIITSMGGFLSLLRIFLADCVACTQGYQCYKIQFKTGSISKSELVNLRANLKLLVAILALNSILYFLNGEQRRLLVLLKRAEEKILQ